MFFFSKPKPEPKPEPKKATKLAAALPLVPIERPAGIPLGPRPVTVVGVKNTLPGADPQLLKDLGRARALRRL
jgi:hypothetical protein